MSVNPKLFESKASIAGVIPTTDITLRDLFAAFSLAGMNAAINPEIGLNGAAKDLAAAAYADADAMLKERNTER